MQVQATSSMALGTGMGGAVSQHAQVTDEGLVSPEDLVADAKLTSHDGWGGAAVLVSRPSANTLPVRQPRTGGGAGINRRANPMRSRLRELLVPCLNLFLLRITKAY
jgi:hypothetical protein